MNKAEIKRKINEVSQKIAERFHPEKIILFGSFAWGVPNQGSDVDLFVVKETVSTRKTAREIDGEMFPRPFAIDLVVYTPLQVKKRMADGDVFINEVFSRGKVLYAKK